jgi:hypothetical protein
MLGASTIRSARYSIRYDCDPPSTRTLALALVAFGAVVALRTRSWRSPVRGSDATTQLDAAPLQDAVQGRLPNAKLAGYGVGSMIMAITAALPIVVVSMLATICRPLYPAPSTDPKSHSPLCHAIPEQAMLLRAARPSVDELCRAEPIRRRIRYGLR